MSVVNALNTAVYSVLSANATLTTLLGGTAIYYQQAPDNAALPYVVFSHQAGQPDNTHGHDMRNQLVFVRGYSGTVTQAGSIDLICGTTLHRRSLSVTGYTNFWTAREQEFSMIDNEPNGEKTYMAGAYYRVRLTPS
jgi:hypothetical protein